jgi:hypothetical protein
MNWPPEQWVECTACDGSGIQTFRVTVYEHGCGFPHDDSDERPCPHCFGRGGWIDDVQADSEDEMMKALEADGEKLRQLTGEDHGPFDEPLGKYPYRAGALEATLRKARETLAFVHTDVKSAVNRDKITHTLESIDDLMSKIAFIDNPQPEASNDVNDAFARGEEALGVTYPRQFGE